MLPPVILMHRLDSSHLESHSWLQRKLPSKDCRGNFKEIIVLWLLFTFQGPPGPYRVPGRGPERGSSQAGEPFKPLLTWPGLRLRLSAGFWLGF